MEVVNAWKYRSPVWWPDVHTLQWSSLSSLEGVAVALIVYRIRTAAGRSTTTCLLRTVRGWISIDAVIRYVVFCMFNSALEF